jgi:16S rRNA (adenine1518-N6/adenine1519-N6)-dimethyltransferase
LSSRRPHRKWGQNFLRNPSAARKIVSAVEPEPGELVLEIGPGEGVLTSLLQELPNRVIAIEIDPDLARLLARKYEGTNVSILHADATEAPLPEEPFRAVGNLPYNVGTPILRRIIAAPGFRRAVFMLQKEVADRILAGPGDADYGYLTLFVQAYARPGRVMTLGPGSFFPPPKVSSSVMSLDRHDPDLRNPVREVLDLVSAAFRMRRKKLVNNLTGYRGISKTGLPDLLEQAGIHVDARAETVSLQQFDRLLTAFGPADGVRSRETNPPPSARR